MSSDLFHIDPSRVTSEQAAFLCAHHLSLAAAYFEAAGEDLAALKREAEKTMRDPTLPDGFAVPRLTAAIGWLDRMDALYRALGDGIGG